MNVETSVDRRRVAEGIAYSEIEKKHEYRTNNYALLTKPKLKKNLKKNCLFTIELNCCCTLCIKPSFYLK